MPLLKRLLSVKKNRAQKELTFPPFYQREGVISGVSAVFFNLLAGRVQVNNKVRVQGASYPLEILNFQNLGNAFLGILAEYLHY